jgi:hypothetical protein
MQDSFEFSIKEDKEVKEEELDGDVDKEADKR